MVRIDFFGVTHIARKNKLRKSLREFVEDEEIDAVFIERQDSDPDTETQIKAFFVNPAMIFWKFLYRLISRAIVFFKNLAVRREINWDGDDERVAREFADEENLSLHNTDKSIEKMILDQGLIWSLLSWAVFVFLIMMIADFVPKLLGMNKGVWGLFINSVVFTGKLFVVSSLFLAFPFVCSEVYPRNVYMMQKILEEAKEEDYQRVVMITGKRHIEGFEELVTLSNINYRSEKYAPDTIRDLIKRFLTLLNIK